MPTDSIFRDVVLSRYVAVRLRAIDEDAIDLVAALVATDCAGPRHNLELRGRGGRGDMTDPRHAIAERASRPGEAVGTHVLPAKPTLPGVLRGRIGGEGAFC